MRRPGRKGEAIPVRKSLQRVNWRVQREGHVVVAIEPGDEYENIFTGPDAYGAALDFVVAKIKEG